MTAFSLPRISRAQLALALDREECRRSLAVFVRRAWPHFDPAPYTDGWHIHAWCEHLEAVTSGEIPKLLANFPPRHCKTGILSLWQVWTWIQYPDPRNPRLGPQVTFLCGAYNATKAQEDGVKVREFIRSEWFQERWGQHVKINKNIDNQEKFQTTAGGYRISIGIPESRGKGALIRVIDDYHKGDDIESAVVLSRQIQQYRETWCSRSNSPLHGAEVIVMQRLAHNDLSSVVLDQGGWTHLCLPLEYDPDRHCVTDIGWEDPRGVDDATGERLEGDALEARRGEPLWPSAFPSSWCREQERLVGAYAYAGQYQQIPTPRGGGLIKADWWRLWERSRLPACDLVVAALDGAFTDQSYNDPSAVTVWGRFSIPEVREPQFMLMWAWEGRLAFNDLVEMTSRICRGDWRGTIDGAPLDGATNASIDVLLVENKACGPSVAQEIVRLHGRRKWRTLLVTPKGDKTGRLISVQPVFAGLRRPDGSATPGQVWAPDRDWAQQVIDQVANFPKAGHDDLTDTVSMALRWLREVGAVMTEEEAEEDYLARNRYTRPRRALYPSARRVA